MLTPDLLDKDQLDTVDFIDSGEDSLVSADVGTGKTVIAATAALRALEDGRVNRWLILGPMLVATSTWPDEFAQWAHLNDVPIAVAHGTAKGRKAAIESDAPFVVMNYENLGWLCEEYPKRGKKDAMPFDGIIYDEIDKLKSCSGSRFKAFRSRVKCFNKRIGLSGTMLPTHLTELWGQAYMVDGGQTFGRSFYKWRQKHFYPTDYNQHNWEPHANTYETILKGLGGLIYRLEGKGLPEVVFCDPYRMTLPDEVRELYAKLAKDYVAKVTAGDTEHDIDAVNAGILTGKLQQITAGFLYLDKKCTKSKWHSKQRFDWLQNVLRGQVLDDDEQLLTVYHFREELEELKRVFGSSLPVIGGGTSNAKAKQNIASWNAGKSPNMAIHAQAASHGLNLQKSGARDVAFMTVPWSAGLFRQIMGRLARRGQVNDEVYAHTAPFRNSVDQDVLKVMQDRLDQLNWFMDDVAKMTCRDT